MSFKSSQAYLQRFLTYSPQRAKYRANQLWVPSEIVCACSEQEQQEVSGNVHYALEQFFFQLQAACCRVFSPILSD